MSDRDLRRILEEVIEEIDQGKLRPLAPARLRGKIGGAVLAAALGLGVAACNGRVVGTDTDAGGLPDVAQLDRPDADQIDPLDAEVVADAAVDSGPLTAYGIPQVDAGDMDAGTVVTLDGGVISMYLAMGFDDAGVDALDAGDQPDTDAEINAAYMAPFPESD
jgi:hypothetical protein